MTNLEFYNFIIDEYKLNYDAEFFSLLRVYFKQAVDYLEKAIDFQYMRRTSSFSVLKDTYSIPFTNERVKHFVTVFNKTKQFELTGLSDTELYQRLTDSEGIPRHYSFFNNMLYFTMKHSENTDYVISYYVYSDELLFNDNASHPLINEAFSSLTQTMMMLISKYATPDRLNIDAELLKLYLGQDEKAQAMRKWSTSEVIVKGYERY